MYMQVYMYHARSCIHVHIHVHVYMYIVHVHLHIHPCTQIINKSKPKTELSEEEKHKKMMSFMDRHEKEIKKYGMMKDYSARYNVQVYMYMYMRTHMFSKPSRLLKIVGVSSFLSSFLFFLLSSNVHVVFCTTYINMYTCTCTLFIGVVRACVCELLHTHDAHYKGMLLFLSLLPTFLSHLFPALSSPSPAETTCVTTLTLCVRTLPATSPCGV